MTEVKEHPGVAMAKTFTEWHNEILLRTFREWLDKPHPVSNEESRARYDQKFEEKYGIRPAEAVYVIRSYFDHFSCLCRSLKDTPVALWTEQQKYLFSKLRKSIENQVKTLEEKIKPALEDIANKEMGRQSDPFVGPPTSAVIILMQTEKHAALTIKSICSSFRKGIGLEQSEW